MFSHGNGPYAGIGEIPNWRNTHTLAELKQHAIDNDWKTLYLTSTGAASFFSDAKSPSQYNTNHNDAHNRGAWIYTPPEDPPTSLNGFDLTNLEAEGKFVRIVATRITGVIPGPLFGQIEIGLKGWDKLILYPDVANYYTDINNNMAFENGVLTVYTNSTFFGQWTMTYMLCDDAAWTTASPLPDGYDLYSYQS